MFSPRVTYTPLRSCEMYVERKECGGEDQHARKSHHHYSLSPVSPVTVCPRILQSYALYVRYANIDTTQLGCIEG